MIDFDLIKQMLRETMREVVREEFAALQLPAPAEEDDLLTIQEVCERLSISKTTLWSLRRNGEITGHSVGRRVLFKSSDVNTLVEGSP